MFSTTFYSYSTLLEYVISQYPRKDILAQYYLFFQLKPSTGKTGNHSLPLISTSCIQAASSPNLAVYKVAFTCSASENRWYNVHTTDLHVYKPRRGV